MKDNRKTRAATDRGETLVSPLALRPKDAAEALGIGVRKLWEITSDRTSGIPHLRFGRAVRYPVDGLRAWLADRAGKGGRA